MRRTRGWSSGSARRCCAARKWRCSGRPRPARPAAAAPGVVRRRVQLPATVGVSAAVPVVPRRFHAKALGGGAMPRLRAFLRRAERAVVAGGAVACSVCTASRRWPRSRRAAERPDSVRRRCSRAWSGQASPVRPRRLRRCRRPNKRASRRVRTSTRASARPATSLTAAAQDRVAPALVGICVGACGQ